MLKHRSTLRRLATLIFIVLADSYGLITSLFLLLWLFTQERFFLTNIFINLMPTILLPAIVTLFLGGILRKWHLVTLNLLPILVLIISYSDSFIPPNPPSTNAEPITVLGYNLDDEKYDFEYLDVIFQQANADIMAFQEVNPDALNYLQNYRPEIYPYHSYTIFKENYHGELILSRWPIIEGSSKRPLRSLIETPYGTIAIFSVHLPFPLESGLQLGSIKYHLINLNQLLNMAENENVPTLLIGDFNTSQVTEDYQRLHASYEDIFRKTNIGFGFTFPNLTTNNDLSRYVPPILRIDYIFASHDIIPIESHVIYQGDSDHFPLWARISLAEND